MAVAAKNVNKGYRTLNNFSLNSKNVGAYLDRSVNNKSVN